MKYIDKNEALLKFMTGEKINILSAEINRFDIFYKEDQLNGDQLNIDVYITLMYFKSDKELKLQFKNVTEYCMYHNSTHHFYYIERYKFLKYDKGFYISFDPYEEISGIQPEDNDFIVSKEIEGHFL